MVPRSARRNAVRSLGRQCAFRALVSLLEPATMRFEPLRGARGFARRRISSPCAREGDGSFKVRLAP
jgi:hypothetical protein